MIPTLIPHDESLEQQEMEIAKLAKRVAILLQTTSRWPDRMLGPPLFRAPYTAACRKWSSFDRRGPATWKIQSPLAGHVPAHLIQYFPFSSLDI